MKKEAGRSKNYRTDKDNRQKKEYPKKEAGEKMISGNNRKNYGDDNHKKRDMNRKNSSGRNKSEDRKSVKESGRGKQRTGNVSREQNTPGNCIYAKKCGGCQYQGISYKKQLKKKQKYVEELLGGMVPVEPILGMDDPFHYRNKVNAAFQRLRNGHIISGVYKQGTHEVVDIVECQIEDARADKIIQDIKGLLPSFKIKTYDEDSDYGLLRHVMVRTGHVSGEVMVVLVVVSPVFPSKNNFVKAIRKLHPEISTIVLNVNDKRTSMVLGTRNITLYGRGYIEDTLCGLTFRISPSSFYQINSVQTEALYQTAVSYAKLTGKERVLDAYCGIGTIGMVAAKHAKEVIGVELNAAAVRDAVTNAKRNQMKHIVFYNQDAGEFMVQLAEKGEHVDVVFMDPPRAGSTEVFMDSVAKLSPDRVVYVSCDPTTLARDLKYFKKKGYDPKKCQPVDMFPYTEHCEVVCLLTKMQ
ncbi:MAG: 23S rRNA (uracil(1939)-C(5))-methyltransferase RlmD [Lachnospiraceae bacterium]|nr:23S rRNA (uracil(1939)-C(5))-methyltransferase RlmD [Lachnospiraceae bacterium]